MSEDLVKPGDDPVHFFDGMEMGQRFHKTLLQEIFGEGGIAETTGEEGVKGLAMVE
jgi:hypothetical protein